MWCSQRSDLVSAPCVFFCMTLPEACACMHFLPCSPHAIPDRLRLRVNRISLPEYDRLQYDKERLRDICKNAVAPPWPLRSFSSVVLVICSYNANCSNNPRVYCSDPSRHRGGERRLRPGDVQTLHRPVTGGKSPPLPPFSPPLLLSRHHYFMAPAASLVHEYF